MNHEHLQRLRENYGGPLSQIELEYLFGIDRLLGSALEGQQSFKRVGTLIMDDLRTLCTYRFNLEQAIAAGEWLHASQINLSQAENVEPLTAKEKKMLENTSKMMEFGIRNGLGFFFPLEITSHDFGEYERYDYDLKHANLSCFSPKATGWAELDEDSFGETGT